MLLLQNTAWRKGDSIAKVPTVVRKSRIVQNFKAYAKTEVIQPSLILSFSRLSGVTFKGFRKRKNPLNKISILSTEVGSGGVKNQKRLFGPEIGYVFRHQL